MCVFFFLNGCVMLSAKKSLTRNFDCISVFSIKFLLPPHPPPFFLLQPWLLPHLWPVLFSVGLYVFQALLVRFVFQGKTSGFNIINHRLFHNSDFFLFFINIFIGLYSFAVRIGMGILYGLLFVSRLDKVGVCVM